MDWTDGWNGTTDGTDWTDGRTDRTDCPSPRQLLMYTKTTIRITLLRTLRDNIVPKTAYTVIALYIIYYRNLCEFKDKEQ